MNRKIKKYLDEIDKTEKQIEELQQYLKGVRAALREEENSEMIKSIRGMKLQGKELFDLLATAPARYRRRQRFCPFRLFPTGQQSTRPNAIAPQS